MILFYESFIILIWTRLALGTIPGLSYMDPIRQMPLDSKLPGEDPCNPLYWYPRTIPEYCYLKPPVTINFTKNPPLPVPLPVPMPIPVPMPPPQLMPVPEHLPLLPMPLPVMPPPPQIVPAPALPIALPPLYAQSPMLPANPLMAYDTNPQPHFPFPYPHPNPNQVGFVPGLPTLVKRDGGINIMPFSDAYADMLEKHKNKMIRKKLRRIINEYEHFPNTRKYLRLKKYNRLMGL